MRAPRIYHPQPLSIADSLALSDEAANHVGRVLRMQAGQRLSLFDGSNCVFDAEITQVDKKQVRVRVLDAQQDDRESPLNLHLGQVISRGEKMEFTIQKSVELGVNVITPLISERCGVRLEKERLKRKFSSGKKSPWLPANSADATAFRKSAPLKRSKPGALSLVTISNSTCIREPAKASTRFRCRLTTFAC